MKIELGKYRTRGGHIAEVTNIGTMGRYCVEVKAPGKAYCVTLEGRVVNNREHPFDLVERLPDEKKTITRGRYRTRDGRIATVERADGCDMRGVSQQGRIFGQLDGPYSWFLDGHASYAGEHPCDLVERLDPEGTVACDIKTDNLWRDAYQVLCPVEPNFVFRSNPWRVEYQGLFTDAPNCVFQSRACGGLPDNTALNTKPDGFHWTVWAELLRELASDAAAKVGVPTGDVGRMLEFLRSRFTDPVLRAAVAGDDEAMVKLVERDDKASDKLNLAERIYTQGSPEWAWDQMVAGKRVIRTHWEDNDKTGLRLVAGEVRTEYPKPYPAFTYGRGREDFLRSNSGAEFKLSAYPKVAEGSPEWAWDQMAAGKRVRVKGSRDARRILVLKDDGVYGNNGQGIFYVRSRSAFLHLMQFNTFVEVTGKYRFKASATNPCSLPRILIEAPAGWKTIRLNNEHRKKRGERGITIFTDAGGKVQVHDEALPGHVMHASLDDTWSQVNGVIEVEVCFT